MYSKLAVCILFFIISNTIFCQDYSNLVINEIMVSNDSIITDEYGEFDDWIEIYNKGDQIINLEGLHLSDSYADLDKYTFPSIFLLRRVLLASISNLPNKSATLTSLSSETRTFP